VAGGFKYIRIREDVYEELRKAMEQYRIRGWERFLETLLRESMEYRRLMEDWPIKHAVCVELGEVSADIETWVLLLQPRLRDFQLVARAFRYLRCNEDASKCSPNPAKCAE